MRMNGQPIVAGDARGTLLVCRDSLSIWGGIDPKTGQIIDRRHDRFGEFATGRIFAIPAEKGSSTGSAVLLELIRVGKAPAAIITSHLAPIIALGSIIAAELYAVTLPIILLSEDEYVSLPDGGDLHVGTDGILSITD